MNRKRISIVLLGFSFCICLQAQRIDDILNGIEQNNKELQAVRHRMEADRLEVSTNNNLEDPSVEYSPFFTSGVDGMASSELVVSQGFDFPTLYAARSKEGRLQQEALDYRELSSRRDILLRAKNLCLDLIYLNQQDKLLKHRLENADELLALFEKRLKEGDVNILDVNKIKMERMSVNTEVAQNNSAHRAALQQLLAMNGNKPVEFTSDVYPDIAPLTDMNALYDEVVASDAELLAADADMRASAQTLNVAKQNWLPKLEIGYRRNTSVGEKSNGFLIGGSLPLFSNRKKKQIAKAQAVSAELQLEEVRLQTEAQTHSLFNEIKQLSESLESYDVPLMKETLDLLKEAVMAGQISIIEYYTEADIIYRNLQTYMGLENRYQKLVAEAYRHRL
ncbi:TolC family protein [uncultured Bacteroides sp.]|uniref:TolC family protein n=1 Tax=uncultured Bacteroides sp. TaxID=162156 RepID=UPI0026145F55|nr:TolC family protein [uncultured Bacteroides sp.]